MPISTLKRLIDARRDLIDKVISGTLTILLMAFAFFSIWEKHWGQYLYNSILLFWVMGGCCKQSFNLFKEKKAFIVIAAFLLLLVLGLSWSIDIRYGKEVCHRYGYLLLIPVFVPLINSKNGKWIILALLSGLAFIVANSYLIQYHIFHQSNPDLFPALNLTYNEYSFYLGVILLASVYFAMAFFHAKQWRKSLALILIIIPIGYRLIDSRGRGALVGTLVAFAVLVFAKYPKAIKKAILPVFFGLAIVVWIGWNYAPIFKSRFIAAYQGATQLNRGNIRNSVGIRWAYLDVGTSMVLDHPFLGLGTGSHTKTFDHLVKGYKSGIYASVPKYLWTYHFHNDYLEIAVQVGLLGLFVYLGAMFCMVWDLRESRSFPLIVSILTLFWINGLSDVMFVHGGIIYFMTLALGLSYAESTIRSTGPQKESG
jgi:O-antigen ligase